MSKARSGPARMSLADLERHVAKYPAAARGDALAVLRGELTPAPGTAAALIAAERQSRVRPSTPTAAATALSDLMGGASTKKKRKEGPSALTKITASIQHALVQVRVIRRPDGHPQEVVIWFAGARLMSQNELISALQKNIKGYFGYKKAWKERMGLARDLIHGQGPCQFVDPVKIEVLRQARNLADRDGLTPQFKILIDELRHPGLLSNRQPDPSKPAILLDDNAFRVVDVIPFQRQVRAQDPGTRGVGMRLIACPGWVPEEAPDPIRDWLAVTP